MKKILALSFIVFISANFGFTQSKPNVVIIYADDLGYGDLGCYGATKLKTPNIDKLAAKGIRFTNAHTTSATCTPSRYALITGKYPWKRSGTSVLPGDAALIVPTDKITLPKVFKTRGYQTGIVGKWHLGLGDKVEKNWNSAISPGPNEVGFDYSYIFPATADRVPTVFIENHDVQGIDAQDPINVNYSTKIGNNPTGKENPELLKMTASHGHNNTIVNGIGRIGFMTGGTNARWTDEEVSYTFLNKAVEFIEANTSKPFFLYFSLTEPHVPRMPATAFKGKSGLGFRGDAILQLDWTVGEITKQIEKNGLSKNTIIIFTSDNGPVLDDGYNDEAVIKLNGHTPWGALRGGKYSSFEAGTRVPFILSWPAKVINGTSDALVCQIDLLSSFANLLKQEIPKEETQALDSQNLLNTFLGFSKLERGNLVLSSNTKPAAIIKDNWKYIEPDNGPSLFEYVNIESGNSPMPQLYNLKNDIGERNNVAEKYPEKLKELSELFKEKTNLK